MKAEVQDIEVRAVQTGDEMLQACDLIAKVHAVDYFSAIHWLSKTGEGYPGFRREHTRIARWRGELAGAVRVNVETLRLGEARLRMGGFGWVTTSPAHRNRGVGRALMAGTLAYLRELGCHVSMLFGIPNFYHRFGFTTTLSDYATIVRVPEIAEAGTPDCKVRPGKPGDIRAIQRIHNANDSETACSIVRTAAHIGNQWERWKDVRVITDPQGAVAGYYLPRQADDELVVEEAGVTGRAICAALLSACARQAADACLPRIRLRVPPPHPLGRYLLEFQSVHEMRTHRNGEGMMAFVSLGETLESMIPEWESRLARHAARAYRTEATLVVDGAPYRVRANRGAIDIANTPGKNKFGCSAAELMHLVTGFRFLDDVHALQRRIITAEARELLGVIFPKRAPYVSPPDRF